MITPVDIFQQIDSLIDNWCERRALKPLRLILPKYPLCNGLTDEWAELLDSLKDIKGLCGNDLAPEEKTTVTKLIQTVENIVHR